VAQVGQLLVNLYINPKLIFMTLSPSIYLLSMLSTLLEHVAKLMHNLEKFVQKDFYYDGEYIDS